MKSLDEVRAKYPHLGMTLYAIEPGKPVTLEIITPDQRLFSFVGATEEAAIAVAFPDEDTPESERAAVRPPDPPRSGFATREDASLPAPPPTTSVFD